MEKQNRDDRKVRPRNGCKRRDAALMTCEIVISPLVRPLAREFVKVLNLFEDY